MKIVDIQRFINNFKLISEAVTLPNIRQGILGKKGKREYPVIDDDKEWYEEHKSEVVSAIEKALNVEDKSLQIKLQKFDLEDFFTTDKPRKLKVREMLKAVRRNFISQLERRRLTEEKTSGIDSQYEMIEMMNGVEVYAVYNPMSNRYLTHTKLHVDGCFSPTWCIASSSANNYWNHYYLYEAEYPSVFIVAQKVKNSYNPIKYELKCDPHKSISFKEGDISLEDWVDEWRNPQQNESENSFNGTSLFKRFNISPRDLEDVIRKLVNTKKAETFSKKYGKEMLNLYTQKINHGDEDTKMEYLTKACKNGTFINFCNKIKEEDIDYFLDELIRYETLTEAEVEEMGLHKSEKALLNLIKNKRCTHISLKWAKIFHGKNMIKKVFRSLPDDVLLLPAFGNNNIRRSIFSSIKEVDGLTDEYLNYLLAKESIDNEVLILVNKDDSLFRKCCEVMLSKGEHINGHTFPIIEKYKDLVPKFLDKCIENEYADFDIFKYIIKFENYRNLKKAIEILIGENKLNEDYVVLLENIYGKENKSNPIVVESISKIINHLHECGTLTYDALLILLFEDFDSNLEETFGLLFKNLNEDDKTLRNFVNKVTSLQERRRPINCVSKDYISIVIDLILTYNIYDEKLFFVIEREYLPKMVIAYAKSGQLSQTTFLEIIANNLLPRLTRKKVTEQVIDILDLNISDIMYDLISNGFYNYNSNCLRLFYEYIIQHDCIEDSHVIEYLLDENQLDEKTIKDSFGYFIDYKKDDVVKSFLKLGKEDLIEKYIN